MPRMDARGRSGLAWLAAAVVLAGCSSPPADDAPAAAEPCVVTGPTDPSCDAATAAVDPTAVQHLHDYWGGSDRITVLEQTKPSPVGFAGGPAAIARFRPEPGNVVPQGTGTVLLTLDWTVQPEDVAGGFELLVKSAGVSTFHSLGMVAQGQTVELNTSHTDNDLPHQSLSGWLVDVVVHPDAMLGFAHYYGDTTLRVEAVRGLEIPLYPGHPDRWEGRTEIELLSVEQDVTYFGDPRTTFQGCAGNASCLQPLRPDLGAVVPLGAATVEVTMAWDSPEPLALGLTFHGADSDEFVELQPSANPPASRSYSILVTRGMEDGPYAVQSLWEFLPVVAGPVPNGAFTGTVTYTATAVKG